MICCLAAIKLLADRRPCLVRIGMFCRLFSLERAPGPPAQPGIVCAPGRLRSTMPASCRYRGMQLGQPRYSAAAWQRIVEREFGDQVPLSGGCPLGSSFYRQLRARTGSAQLLGVLRLGCPAASVGLLLVASIPCPVRALPTSLAASSTRRALDSAKHRRHRSSIFSTQASFRRRDFRSASRAGLSAQFGSSAAYSVARAMRRGERFVGALAGDFVVRNVLPAEWRAARESRSRRSCTRDILLEQCRGHARSATPCWRGVRRTQVLADLAWRSLSSHGLRAARALHADLRLRAGYSCAVAYGRLVEAKTCHQLRLYRFQPGLRIEADDLRFLRTNESNHLVLVVQREVWPATAALEYRIDACGACACGSGAG